MIAPNVRIHAGASFVCWQLSLATLALEKIIQGEAATLNGEERAALRFVPDLLTAIKKADQLDYQKILSGQEEMPTFPVLIANLPTGALWRLAQEEVLTGDHEGRFQDVNSRVEGLKGIGPDLRPFQTAQLICLKLQEMLSQERFWVESAD